MQPRSQQAQETALSEAMALARSGEFDAAARNLRRILAQTPNQPDALQLLGMVARQRGRHEEAVALFRKSLTVRPSQPHVLNNLGNSLLDLGEHAGAAAAYREALAQHLSYDDARINLALALIRLDKLRDAEAALRPLLDRTPGNGRAWAALGEVRSAANDHAGTIDAYREALRLVPDHLPWLHNLAVALRQTGHAREALPILFDCAAKSPEQARIAYNLGHCLQDLGRFDEAARAYRHAIKLAPTNAEIHDSLSRMLWLMGKTSEHVQSYREALAAHPDHPDLLAGLANRLTLAGDAQQAAALLERAVARGVGGADLRCLLGQAFWSSGRPHRASEAFDEALALDPQHPATLRESARSLLILDRPDEAMPRVERRLAADPDDQQALALRGIAWRLMGDPRAEWLNDPALIRTFRPSSAEGDSTHFNRRLDAALDALHSGERSPLEQTLRKGTQTADDLFSRDIPEIVMARTMMAAAVAQYIGALPDGTDHPFLRRKGRDFSFSGSWSVRLSTGGHHTNHIHPAGWISAVYYVALPERLEGKEGWLKFGETGLRLGQREHIMHTIRPEPGLLVLFPSYFYHGTIPFSGDGHRTTIAFDIVPAGSGASRPT